MSATHDDCIIVETACAHVQVELARDATTNHAVHRRFASLMYSAPLRCCTFHLVSYSLCACSTGPFVKIEETAGWLPKMIPKLDAGDDGSTARHHPHPGPDRAQDPDDSNMEGSDDAGGGGSGAGGQPAPKHVCLRSGVGAGQSTSGYVHITWLG